MTSKEVVDSFIDECGWDDTSVITLLTDFIDSHGLVAMLRERLQQQKEMEEEYPDCCEGCNCDEGTCCEGGCGDCDD